MVLGKNYLQKSKIVLLCSFSLIILLFILRIRLIKTSSNFKLDDTIFIGRVNLIEKYDTYSKIGINIDGENITGTYYGSKINIYYNDLIKINGMLKEIDDDGNFSGFSYKEYLKRHNQFYLLEIDNIEVIKRNNNIFYMSKNFIIKRIGEVENSNYLYAFILGNTSFINNRVYTSYQNNGISHLFAISGMHLSFFIEHLKKILNKFNEKKVFVIISLFLFFYSFLVGFTPSVLRASLLYLFSYFTKNRFKSLFYTLIVVLLYNPYYVYELGFQLSFLMSFILIIFSREFKNYSKIKRSILTSLVTFIASIPIIIFNFSEINIFTPLYNLFYIFYVSNIVFPLSFIVFIIPKLSFIYLVFILLLEKSSLFLDGISISRWIMKKPGILGLFLLIILVVLTLYFIGKNKFIYLIMFLIFLFLYHNINYFKEEDYITFLDVGQGDSILVNSKSTAILIDTGGSIYQDIANKKVIPYLKRAGILSIKTIILSHGDYDHMGSSIDLIDNFKVESVIFNCGEFNELEQELIKVLEKRKIPYYSCLKELEFNSNKLYFLNNNIYENENDNSSVIYTEFNNFKFLFMGDGSRIREVDLISKYKLKNIDVLKVGHHGSKTSSCKEFIDEVNPKYSVISVGKDNIYNHPNEVVLENLKNSKVYRTDINGGVMFKFYKDSLRIKLSKGN